MVTLNYSLLSRRKQKQKAPKMHPNINQSIKKAHRLWAYFVNGTDEGIEPSCPPWQGKRL